MTTTLDRPPVDATAADPHPRRVRAVREPSWGAAHALGIATAFAGLVAGAVVFLQWFRPGKYLAVFDITPFVRTSLQHEFGWQWTHQNSGAGGPSYELARLPEAAFSRLGVVLGGGEPLGQALFFAAIFAFGAFGGAALVGTIVRRPLIVAAAGLIAVFNPYVLVNAPNPLPVLTIGMLGAGGALVAGAALDRRSHPILLALITLPASYLVINPPLLAILVVWFAALPVVVLVALGRDGCRRVLRLYGIAALFAVPLSLWWAVPTVFALRGAASAQAIGAETDAVGWSWTHVNSTIANLVTLRAKWNWPDAVYTGRAAYAGTAPYTWLQWFLPVLAASAAFLLRGRRRRFVVGLLVTSAALLVLGAGLHPPFRALNTLIYRSVPGMWLFREPMSKYGAILVLLYVVAAALALEVIVQRIARWSASRRGRQRVAASVLVIAVAVPLVAVLPMLSGAIAEGAPATSPDFRVAVPAEWHRVADVVNDDPATGKALVLPLDDFYMVGTTWGYYGADQLVRQLFVRPVILRSPESYIRDTPEFDALVLASETAIASADTAALPNLFRSLDVSHVVVRKDIDYDSSIRRPAMRRPEPLIAALEHAPGVRRQLDTGVATVFRVADAPGAVETVGGLLRTGAVADDRVAPLVVGAPEGLAIATDPGRWAVGRSWASAPAALSTTFRSHAAGAWTAKRVPLGIPLMAVAAAGDATGAVVRLTDGTRATVGGVELPSRPAIDVPAGPGTVVGAYVDGRYVDLTGGSVLARVAASSLVIPVVRRPDVPSVLLDLPAFDDCHRYDRRTPEQSGFDAQLVAGADAADDVLRLTAARHSACLSTHTQELVPGESLHLALEYRKVEGAAPRACLWLIGPDVCAALPPTTAVGDGWSRLATTWTVSSGVTAARLLVYADEPPGDGRTVAEYRRGSLERVESAAPVVVGVGDAASATVELPAGSSEVRTEAMVEPVVGQFGAVADCDRRDDRSARALGIRSTIRDGAVLLAAREHSACRSAELSSLVPGASYELRFRYRTVRGAPARVCVRDAARGGCAPLDRDLDESPGWHDYRARFRLDERPSPVPPRVFLYADGEGAGSVTEYRDVAISATADESVVLITAAARPRAVPETTWAQDGPTRYRVSVRGATGAFALVLSDSWSDGWELGGLPEGVQARQVRIDGYRNGWLLDATGDLDLTIEYRPARWGRYALGISALALAAAVAVGGGTWWRRRRRHGARVRPEARRVAESYVPDPN